jgi:hypothetical protein
MSQLVQAHIDLLSAINKSSTDKVAGIIKHSSNKVTYLYSELALNVLKGVVPITTKERRRFAGFKPLLKILTVKQHSLKKKQSTLNDNIQLVRLLTRVVVRYFLSKD